MHLMAPSYPVVPILAAPPAVFDRLVGGLSEMVDRAEKKAQSKAAVCEPLCKPVEDEAKTA